MLDSSETAPPGGAAPRLDLLGSRLEQSLALATEATGRWRARSMEAIRSNGHAATRHLLQIPDIGPACEVVLADQLFYDLRGDERAGLMSFIRGSQDSSGAWLGPDGHADLALTVLGWWARAQSGDDPDCDSMIRAQRVVHALGGAQRANFQVRLWLAMAGQIPWSFLPAIPSELFLLPPPMWLSPARFCPWARGILTPYFLIARAPARLHLADATPLLLRRGTDDLVAPRLTRHGLAGDLLQAFDRTVKLSRKLPRGPLPRWATEKAEKWIDRSQQQNGGWFSLRPTILSLVALRVMGAESDDSRVRSGLDYLRRARGIARIARGIGEGDEALAQGLVATPLSTAAALMRCDPRRGQASESDVAWLLRQELTEPGPWQVRADAPAGGWPVEAGAQHHLDLEATCSVLDTVTALSAGSSQVAPAWATTRRATDVIVAMQEGDGSFSRFERGESRVFMQRLPWTDADLLAYGTKEDPGHVRLSALALAHLGRTGFAIADDRVARGVAYLERATETEHDHRSIATLSALARCAGAVCPNEHSLRASVESRLRSRQREDGSFGEIVDTSRGLIGLLSLGPVCVQATRAARNLAASVEKDRAKLEYAEGAAEDGFGLTPVAQDPSANAREAVVALRTFAESGGTL